MSLGKKFEKLWNYPLSNNIYKNPTELYYTYFCETFVMFKLTHDILDVDQDVRHDLKQI